MKNKQAVVLVSGGLDSLTCLAIAKDEGYQIHMLSFDYGQRSQAEINAAQLFAKKFEVLSHQIISIPVQVFQHSALTDKTIQVPTQVDKNVIPVTYVPARNTLFISYGLAYAESVEAECIIYGASAIDYSNYPDCRPEYVARWQDLIKYAVKTSFEGNDIKLYAPLIDLSKAETIQKGLSLGVDYSLSVSCYQADEDGKACGSCPSCQIRRNGFKEVGVEDPTRYLKNYAKKDETVF
ncbi:MAG: 7-cyano-7-deazaguanine synthase QueC [Gammaproteobacteria bacterium]